MASEYRAIQHLHSSGAAVFTAGVSDPQAGAPVPLPRPSPLGAGGCTAAIQADEDPEEGPAEPLPRAPCAYVSSSKWHGLALYLAA